MAFEPRQLFRDVTAIGQISDFLSQPGGIDFDCLSFPSQQFRDAFVQPLAVTFDQTVSGRCRSSGWRPRFCPSRDRISSARAAPSAPRICSRLSSA